MVGMLSHESFALWGVVMPAKKKTPPPLPKAKPTTHTPGKAGLKRGRHEQLQDRRTLLSLMRQGYTQSAVAEHLGVSITQVQYEWSCTIRELREGATEDAKAIIAVKLEELGEIKREAWCEWKRSKGDSTKEVNEHNLVAVKGKTGDKRSKPVVLRRELRLAKKTTTKEGRLGDPRFLQVVLGCIQAERELQALDPPKVTQVTGAINWALLYSTIPTGPVSDEVEDEIEKVMEGSYGTVLEHVPLPPEATQPGAPVKAVPVKSPGGKVGLGKWGDKEKGGKGGGNGKANGRAEHG